MKKKKKATFIRLFKMLGKTRGLLVLVAIFAIIYAATLAVGPKVMGMIITEISDGAYRIFTNTGRMDYTKIITIVIGTAILYLVNYVFKLLQDYTMTGVSQKLIFVIRQEVSKKINKLPLNYYESRKFGEIISTVTYDIELISEGMQKIFSVAVSSIASAVFILVVMIYINPIMAIIVVLTLPLSIFGIRFIVGRAKKSLLVQQQHLSSINGMIEENITGFQIVKSFTREEKSMKEFDEENETLRKAFSKSMFMNSLMEPVTFVVGNIGYIAVIVAGAILALKGAIAIGDIQAFINYVNNFNQPVQNIAKIGNDVQSMITASERVFAFLDEKEEEPVDEEKEISDVTGVVDFDDVSFGYVEDRIIINDFNLHVEKGKQIAIVGPTGAGKTTLVKLLMRFYDVNKGNVLVDNNKLIGLKRNSLRENIGMVLQETWLYDESIMENIRFGRLDATDEEVIEAAKMAEADYFINTLPGKYDFKLIENGGNISVGQRQLITIARAILADRPILILDEATSSVDTQTEQSIQRAMDRLMEGRTSFVIAHRLSTIKGADSILVLKDGDVIEQGNHDALMEKEGFYFELYNSQFA